MTQKSNIRRVKAWAVLTNGKLEGLSDIRTTHSNAKIYAHYDPSGVYAIVPCTITYSLPPLKKECRCKTIKGIGKAHTYKCVFGKKKK